MENFVQQAIQEEKIRVELERDKILSKVFSTCSFLKNNSTDENGK